MRIFWLALLAGGLCTGAPTSSAQQLPVIWNDANTLHDTCESTDPGLKGFCAGIIVGAIEALSFLDYGYAKAGLAQQRLCIPAGKIQMNSMVDIVKSYMKDDPDGRLGFAMDVVYGAMLKLYKC